MLLDSVAYSFPHMLLDTPIKSDKNGVYIGIDILFGKKIYWHTEQSPRHHMLVVGPTGSGKTIALTTIATRLANLYNTTLAIFDVKGEYASLIRLFTDKNFIAWNVLQTPIPICNCSEAQEDITHSIRLFINTLNSLYKLPTYIREQIHEQLTKLCKYCYEASLDNVLRGYWVEESETMYTTLSIFGTASESSAPLHLLYQKNVVMDLSKLFLLDPKAAAIATLYVLKRMLRVVKDLNTSPIAKIVLLDELWYLAQSSIEDLVNILIRYSRGYGIALAMATQSIDDLNPYADVIAENCSTILALSSSSRNYWVRLSRYLNLGKKGIENATKFVGQGIGVAKLYPHEKPFYVYIDPID
jgi:type IV secretory pathway VirB4 component